SGLVSFAGTTPGNGLTLTIRTSDGYSVTLTHLGSFGVHTGTSAAEGAPVGLVGPAGNSAAADVTYAHLCLRLPSDAGGYLDPLTLLPSRSALPPTTEASPPVAAGSDPPPPAADLPPTATSAAPAPLVSAAPPSIEQPGTVRPPVVTPPRRPD